MITILPSLTAINVRNFPNWWALLLLIGDFFSFSDLQSQWIVQKVDKCCPSPCRRRRKFKFSRLWGSSLDLGQRVPVRKNSIVPQATPPHPAMIPKGRAAAAPGGVLVIAKWCKGRPPEGVNSTGAIQGQRPSTSTQVSVNFWSFPLHSLINAKVENYEPFIRKSFPRSLMTFCPNKSYLKVLSVIRVLSHLSARHSTGCPIWH